MRIPSPSDAVLLQRTVVEASAFLRADHHTRLFLAGNIISSQPRGEVTIAHETGIASAEPICTVCLPYPRIDLDLVESHAPSPRVVAVNDPPWSDDKGWVDPSNYRTIRPVISGGRLHVIARANGGVITLVLDRNAGGWVDAAADLTVPSDVNGWGHPQFYETIRPIDVGGTLHLIARAIRGLLCWRLDAATGTWTELPELATLSDEKGWHRERNYSTIRPVDLGGRLAVVARANAGMRIWALNDNGGWVSAAPGLADVQDAEGFLHKRCYSTVEPTIVGGRLFVIGRSEDGLGAWRLDDGTGWTSADTLTALSDAAGWDDERYYTTIRPTASDGHLVVVARSIGGLRAWKLDESDDGNELKWTALSDHPSQQWTGEDWREPSSFMTITPVAVGDELYVIGRASQGIEAVRLDRSNRVWESIAHPPPVWSDIRGWGQASRYETISALTDGRDLYLMGRSRDGLGTLRLDSTGWTLPP